MARFLRSFPLVQHTPLAPLGSPTVLVDSADASTLAESVSPILTVEVDSCSITETVSIVSTGPTGTDSGSSINTVTLIALSTSDAATVNEITAVTQVLSTRDSGQLGAGWSIPTGVFSSIAFGSTNALGVGTPAFVAAGPIDSVVALLKKSGSPTDNLYVDITSGTINGTVVATSNTISAASLTTSATSTRFTFPDQVPLVLGQTYFFRMIRTGAASGTNFFFIGLTPNAAAGYTFTGLAWNSGDPVAIFADESESLTQQYADSDAGSVTESPSLALSTADSGTGSDTAKIAVSDSDSGVVTESTAVTQIKSSSDSGQLGVGFVRTNNGIGWGGTSTLALATAGFVAVGPIDSAQVFVAKAGSPTDNIYIDITSGAVDGTVVATSNTIVGSSLPTNVETLKIFSFPNLVPLVPGQTYFFRIQRTGSADNTNQYSILTANVGTGYELLSGSWISSDPISIFAGESEALTQQYADTDSAHGLGGHGIYRNPSNTGMGQFFGGTGSSFNHQSIGASFVGQGLVDRVLVRVRSNGSPTDAFYADITQGSVTGTVVATSASVNGSTLTHTFSDTWLYFPNPVVLAVGTTYYIRLWRTGTLSDTNNYEPAPEGQPTTAGVLSHEELDTGGWSTSFGITLFFGFPESGGLVASLSEVDSGTGSDTARIAVSDVEAGAASDSVSIGLTATDVGFAAIGTPNMNPNSGSTFGASVAVTSISISFVTTGSIGSLNMSLRQIGSPTDNVYVDITDATITGTVVATSNQIAGSTLSTLFAQITTFTFPSLVPLVAGNTYYVRVWRTGVIDSINAYGLEFAKDQGSYRTFNGSSWGFSGGSLPYLAIDESTQLTQQYAVTDAGSVTDTENVDTSGGAIPISSSDSGSSTDTAAIALVIATTDSATETDSVAIALSTTEAATESDTATIAAVVTTADAVTSADLAFIAVAAAETLTSADDGSIAAAITATDSGTLNDGPALDLLTVTTSDTSAATETAAIAATASAIDAASTTEQAALALASAEQAAAADSTLLTAAISLAEALSGVDSATSIGVTGSESGSGGDSTALAVSTTDSAATTETGTLAASVTAPDSGTDSDSVTIALSATQSGTVTETGAAGVLIISSDPFTGSEAAKIALSTTDTASINESASIAATVTTTDTSSVAETPSIAISANDSASRIETQSIALSTTESGSLVETPSLATSSSETGTGLDTAAIELAAADTATTTETGTPSILVTTADSALVTEAAALALADQDVQTGSTDTEFISASISSTDVFTATDQVALITVAAQDSAQETEQISLVETFTSTDASAAVESASIFAVISSSEATSGTDTASLTAAFATTDTSTGTEATSLLVALPYSDSATSTTTSSLAVLIDVIDGASIVEHQNTGDTQVMAVDVLAGQDIGKIKYRQLIGAVPVAVTSRTYALGMKISVSEGI